MVYLNDTLKMVYHSTKKQGTGARRLLSMPVDQDPDEEMKLQKGVEK